MPTSAAEDEEVERVYEQMEEILDIQKGGDNVLVLGDWNAVVGEGKDEKEVGKYGLGKRNARGEMMVEFCKRRKMIVSNTWFKQP